jgi:pyruvate,water dikinase
MTSDLIRWFRDIQKGHIHQVGRKAVSLAELARMGIQIPPGFALTLKAHERTMHETGVGERVRHYLGGFEQAHLQSFRSSQRAGNHILTMMNGTRLPEDIRKELFEAYEGLCEVTGISDVPVSVRSSGPISHPGLFDTYLNVRGKVQLEQKVVACWASFFAPRAIADRARQGWPVEEHYIGVAIVRMVNARSAGVLFSVNPITGNLNEVVVEGSWGLGESVVQASVAPDRFTVDKRTMELKEETINEKLSEVILSSEGTIVGPVSPERQAQPCLSKGEIRELVRLAKIVELQYGGIPQDIEWAISAHDPFPANVFFLQARPVVGVQWGTKYRDKPPGKRATNHIADLMVDRLLR